MLPEAQRQLRQDGDRAGAGAATVDYSKKDAKNQEKRADANQLLLEEILEGLARVVVTRRSAGAAAGRFLRVGRGRGVFFHRGAKFVEGAIVPDVLGSDAFGDRLRALELGAAVEEPALLAAVQLEIALGTFTVGIEAGGEDCTAVGTARAGYRANHARSARAELIGAARSALRRLAVVRPLLFCRLFPHRDTRDGYTCDPQTPPSISPDGLSTSKAV